mmetsp:Transcript_59147/g.152096  ORF Transcript_59147/g.152096 Transcript_59147/m.152096 type:complete len:428 (-) Transcript_59147:341-1624(-)
MSELLRQVKRRLELVQQHVLVHLHEQVRGVGGIAHHCCQPSEPRLGRHLNARLCQGDDQDGEERSCRAGVDEDHVHVVWSKEHLVHRNVHAQAGNACRKERRAEPVCHPRGRRRRARLLRRLRPDKRPGQHHAEQHLRPVAEGAEAQRQEHVVAQLLRDQRAAEVQPAGLGTRHDKRQDARAEQHAVHRRGPHLARRGAQRLQRHDAAQPRGHQGLADQQHGHEPALHVDVHVRRVQRDQCLQARHVHHALGRRQVRDGSQAALHVGEGVALCPQLVPELRHRGEEQEDQVRRPEAQHPPVEVAERGCAAEVGVASEDLVPAHEAGEDHEEAGPAVAPARAHGLRASGVVIVHDVQGGYHTHWLHHPQERPLLDRGHRLHVDESLLAVLGAGEDGERDAVKQQELRHWQVVGEDPEAPQQKIAGRAP